MNKRINAETIIIVMPIIGHVTPINETPANKQINKIVCASAFMFLFILWVLYGFL